MKVTKNNHSFYVNSFEGSFFATLKKALVNFGMTFARDSFWKRFQKNKWERETFQIFDRFLDKNHNYIDIGAWIGPTVLYGAQIAKHCYAVEPDPSAIQSLKSNIALNPGLAKKITVFNGAISNKTGKAFISARFSLGDSMSSLIAEKSLDSALVDCLTFEDFISSFRIKECNFIKIDVEGAEAFILPSMLDYIKINKPTIHISIHPSLFRDLEKDSKKLLSIFKLYKNIYDSNLKIVDERFLLKKLNSKAFFDIVLTDLNWNNN
jgi:FkbM family methyltransferase